MTYVLGCDVSFWQDNNSTPQQINFHAMRQAGARFVFIRAGQLTWPDSDYDYNWRESKAAGLLRGAYHFFDYRSNAANQARWFAGVMKPDMGELPPVLDVEIVSAWGRPTRANILAAIQSYATTFQAETGKRLMIYTNPDMLINVLKPVPDWLSADYPLWVAHYGTQSPRHDGWPRWTFWQFTDRGDGAKFGVESAQIDLNYFNGSEEELRVFAGIDPPPPPPQSWQQAIDAWARSQGYTGPGPND